MGPHPRTVINDRRSPHQPFEILDSGGVIVRRLIELADADADVGAMYLRNLLWRLHERVGDGTATAAVLFDSVWRDGYRYLISGGSAPHLRNYLERGMHVLVDELRFMTRPCRGRTALAGLALSLCYDREMAELFGEIFTIVGADGRIEIREHQSRELKREYVEGSYWEGGLLSREMATDIARGRADLVRPGLVVTDLELTDPDDAVAVLELGLRSGFPSLLLIARSVSPAAMAVFLAPGNRQRLPVVAVGTPAGLDWGSHLGDISVLAGGRPLLQAAHDRAASLRLDNFGRARRAWADGTYFGLIGGGGDVPRVKRRATDLRQAMRRESDTDVLERLELRLGIISGGAATLWIGGSTPGQVEARKETAVNTARAVRGALRQGVLPGGGAALLACRQRLQELAAGAVGPDERAAYRILSNAVLAPARTLLENAGVEPAELLGELERCRSGFAYDLETGAVRDMWAAGIVDSAAVVIAALSAAISGAALALTTDVLVHHSKPEKAYQT